MKILISVLCALFLSACAYGTGFSWDNARKIKEGMTEAELTELLGPPYQINMTEKGEALWQWVYVDLYGVSGGTKSLAVPTKDGLVTRAPKIHDSFK